MESGQYSGILRVMFSRKNDNRNESWEMYPASRLSFESHAQAMKSRARSDGKESDEEARRKSACPDLCIFFISASPEQSEIPLVKKWKRRENCQSVMFDEERLDPHGVSNSLHVLTIKY